MEVAPGFVQSIPGFPDILYGEESAARQLEMMNWTFVGKYPEWVFAIRHKRTRNNSQMNQKVEYDPISQEFRRGGIVINELGFPSGATHSSDFYGQITYWRKVPDFVGIESGEQYYCWAYFKGGWIKDSNVCDRRFVKLQPAESDRQFLKLR